MKGRIKALRESVPLYRGKAPSEGHGGPQTGSQRVSAVLRKIGRVIDTGGLSLFFDPEEGERVPWDGKVTPEMTPRVISQDQARALLAYVEEAAGPESVLLPISTLELMGKDRDRVARENDRLKARIILLEDAVEQAQSTVEFLHGCLIYPDNYRYEYPEMTLTHLRQWVELAPRLPGCAHGLFRGNCEACQRRLEWVERRDWARRILDEPE